MKIKILNERLPYSDKKLQRPRVLKGVNPVTSYKWGGASSCPVYYVGDDIYIKHTDWCSVTISKIDTYHHTKHEHIIKGEAWIKIDGAITSQDVIRACNNNSRFNSEDVKMFCKTVIEISEYLEKEVQNNGSLYGRS